MKGTVETQALRPLNALTAIFYIFVLHRDFKILKILSRYLLHDLITNKPLYNVDI